MAEDKRIYRFAADREDAERAQQREEICKYVDQLNQAWQGYALVAGDPESWIKRAEYGVQYMETLEWLHKHGLSDMAGPDESLLPLAYNEATMTYTLPAEM